MALGGLPSLKTLTLTDGHLSDIALEAYGAAMHCGKLPNLIGLNIVGNDIRNEGFKSLALAIRSGKLKHLAELSLDMNNIGDEGLITLADSFREGVSGLVPNLSVLSLSWNSFTWVGLLSLAKALSTGKLPNLSSLRLSCRNNLGDEGAKSLALAIRSGKLINLAELQLIGTGIGDEGLTALADSFREGVSGLVPSLSSLNLDSNSFTEVGLLSLAEALKSGCLNSLNNLYVYGNTPRSEKGVGALVSAYSTNNILTVVVRMDEWATYSELNRRRMQLLERNERNRKILARLVSVPNVQATLGKVYICGNPEVGKTTLSRTLQRSIWEWLITWQSRPHVEKRTRGIDVSQLSCKGHKQDENPITLQVWDMAGQEDFHVVHNAFFPDLGFAGGKATTFVVVCSSENSLRESTEQLEYWLRYIASSCDKSAENLRHVFVVMNNFRRGRKLQQNAEQWEQELEIQRTKFEQRLKIETDIFLVDVRKSRKVRDLKSRLLEHSRNSLRNQFVPDVCHAIQENLSVLSKQREQFPVLHWTEFVEEVQRLKEPRPEDTILAATKYLNEAGVTVIRVMAAGPHLCLTELDLSRSLSFEVNRRAFYTDSKKCLISKPLAAEC